MEYLQSEIRPCDKGKRVANTSLEVVDGIILHTIPQPAFRPSFQPQISFNEMITKTHA